MKPHTIIRKLGIAVALLPVVSSAHAAEPRPFEKLSLTTDDLIAATRLDIYKFRVHVPDKFRVVLRERNRKGDPAREIDRCAFEKDAKAMVVEIRISFLRTDGKLQGFLLSKEGDAVYRIDCSDCSPGGIATIVPLPLRHVPLTKQMLFVHHSQKDMQRWGLDEQRLITIVARQPGKPAQPTDFPRAELVIEEDD